MDSADASPATPVVELQDAGTSPDLRPLALATACWLGVVGVLVYSQSHTHIGIDAYYHVGAARYLADAGLFVDNFPFAVESIWADRYFNKDWLFHVLLIPMLSIGLVSGPKLLVLLLNASIIAALYYCGRSLGARRIGWWLLLVPFGTFGVYIFHLSLCRPHVLSVLFFVLLIMAAHQSQRRLLFVLSALYALAYTGHWQLLGVVGAVDLSRNLLSEDGEWDPGWRGFPLLLAAGAGMVIGNLLHPQFPDNLYGQYLQNVLVLVGYWGEASILSHYTPSELRASGVLQKFRMFAPLLAVFAVTVAHAVHRRKRLPRTGWLLFFYCLVYMTLTWKSQRFMEYAVPVLVLTIAWYWDYVDHKVRARKWAAAALVAAMLAYSIMGLRQLHGQYIQRLALLDDRPLFAGAADYLKANAEPNEIIFTADWDDGPPLFFGAPDQRYLVFLDPFFMFHRSPDRFTLWHEIRTGENEDPVPVILEDFQSRLVFVTPDHQVFLRHLRAAPNAKRVYKGPIGEMIYELTPDAGDGG
jgi:hypothetical protein